MLSTPIKYVIAVMRQDIDYGNKTMNKINGAFVKYAITAKAVANAVVIA